MNEIVSVSGQIPQEVWTVADRLGAIRENVVFVGGAITGALLTDTGASRPRPTEDVDVIVQMASIGGYYRLEEQLRLLGFRNVVAQDVPICRWLIEEIMVDIMPTEEGILGFSNPWYRGSMANSIWHSSASGERIRLISAVYFIASKLTAYYGRGNGNFRDSHDIEDIITVVDGRAELLNDVINAEPDAKQFIASEFARLLRDDDFVQSIDAHLDPDAASQSRIMLILERMKALANLIE